jgi:hypothetical protein
VVLRPLMPLMVSQNFAATLAGLKIHSPGEISHSPGEISHSPVPEISVLTKQDIFLALCDLQLDFGARRHFKNCIFTRCNVFFACSLESMWLGL